MCRTFKGRRPIRTDIAAGWPDPLQLRPWWIASFPHSLWRLTKEGGPNGELAVMVCVNKQKPRPKQN
jgi:hypothetical protein